MPEFNYDPMPKEVINKGECHIPVVLLVDTSYSMDGNPMAELNQGLKEFGLALEEEQLAMSRADVCVIEFKSTVSTKVGFRPAEDYEAPVLCASGCTALNGAVMAGLNAIESRKAEYKKEGVKYYRPWLFLLTDGEPTDVELTEAARTRLQEAIEQKKVVYIPMGIGPDANTALLQSYYPAGADSRPVLKAKANQFKEAFVWLSRSIGVVSCADPTAADEVTLPPVPGVITVGI